MYREDKTILLFNLYVMIGYNNVYMYLEMSHNLWNRGFLWLTLLFQMKNDALTFLKSKM